MTDGDDVTEGVEVTAAVEVTESVEATDAARLIAEGFREVARVDALQPMLPRVVEVDGQAVLVCLDGGEVYALDELCPHEYESMRYGLVHEGRLTCPHHQYVFDLQTGRCTNRRRCVPVQTYAVRTCDGAVFVKV